MAPRKSPTPPSSRTCCRRKARSWSTSGPSGARRAARSTRCSAEIATEMGDKVEIVKMNIDENPETAMAYRVMSVPTLTIFKGGQPVQSVAGAKPKGDLVRFIESAHLKRRRPKRSLRPVSSLIPGGRSVTGLRTPRGVGSAHLKRTGSRVPPATAAGSQRATPREDATDAGDPAR